MQGQPMSRLARAGAIALCVACAPSLSRAQPATPSPASPGDPASGTTPMQAAPPSGAVPKSTPPGPTTPIPPPAATGSEPAPAGSSPATAPAGPKPAGPPTTPVPPPASTTPQTVPGAQPLAPSAKPQTNEIEPNGSPAIPGKATTETVEVPARPMVYVKGQASYDEAFKAIKAAQATVNAAMDKAGLQPSGHPITIFTDTDDKGFKYEEAVPIAAAPQGKPDLGTGVEVGTTPSGTAVKFQHRGPYDEIDSTYATITSYLDNKGLQTDSPYIEEYLNQLTTPDDPYLAVDIYIFIKK